MQFDLPSPRSTWRRPLAAVVALALLLAGVLPALHHHEAEGTVGTHCILPDLANAHFEPLELEHHEPCALCAKTFSSARLELPQAALAVSLAGQPLAAVSQILPPGPPGRDGASRAPPAA